MTFTTELIGAWNDGGITEERQALGIEEESKTIGVK